MTRLANVHLIGWLLAAVLVCLINLSPVAVHAAELHLKAQLIWGTDDDKPDDPKVKEIDPQLRDKLRKLQKWFNWKNYFEINKEEFSLADSGSQRIVMSKKCELEIRHIAGTRIEVKLYGEGKLFQTVRQTIAKGEYLFLAGEPKEKYNDAWIVAISMTDQ